MASCAPIRKFQQSSTFVKEYEDLLSSSSPSQDPKLQQDSAVISINSKQSSSSPTETTAKRPFLDWYTLFVEALDFSDVETLIASQLTCKHVAWLMAQNEIFRKHFFQKMQPFPRLLTYQESDKRKPCWTCDVKIGSDDISDIPKEVSGLRKKIFHKKQNHQPDDDEQQTEETVHPSLSWKVICRRFERQMQGVSKVFSSPEYFRGIWRIPEREIWSKTHLSLIESPPFFLDPKLRRERFWKVKSSHHQQHQKLRSDSSPPVGGINHLQAHQTFQILLQRTRRGDSNALGCFLQVESPIEGFTGTNASSSAALTDEQKKRNVHEAWFTFSFLDRSLHRINEYQPLRQVNGHKKFTSSEVNSGYILNRNTISRFAPTSRRSREERETTAEENDPDLESPEDIVIEVEVFSLGPGIQEPEEILSYPEELANFFNLGDKVSTDLRTAIWKMLRGLSHSDPYQEGIMAKRKKLMKLLLPSLIRDMGLGQDNEIAFQCTGVLWNLSDVDEHSSFMKREDLDQIVKAVLNRVNKYMISEQDVFFEENDDNSNNHENEMIDTIEREARRRRNRAKRRSHALLCPALVGCLWNFPQSLAGTINMFSHNPDELLSVFVRLMKIEILKHDKIQKIRQEKTQEQADEIIGALEKYDLPVPSILFACCHFVARAIFYLDGKVDRVTKFLQHVDAEQILRKCMVILRQRTISMNSLGVALFSRDYAIFFVPLLIGKHSSIGCVELAAFAFDCGYGLPSHDPDGRDEIE